MPFVFEETKIFIRGSNMENIINNIISSIVVIATFFGVGFVGVHYLGMDLFHVLLALSFVIIIANALYTFSLYKRVRRLDFIMAMEILSRVKDNPTSRDVFGDNE